MTAVELLADLPAWGYACREQRTPNPPPSGAHSRETLRHWPAYVRWELRGGADAVACTLELWHVPRETAAGPAVTRLRVDGALTERPGYAQSARWELAGAGTLRVWLDGALAWTVSAGAVRSWFDQEFIVLGEGNRGASVLLAESVSSGGYSSFARHEVRYFAADLRVRWGGREQIVPPGDSDAVHLMDTSGQSGTAPTALRRQPLRVSGLRGGRTGWADDDDLEAVASVGVTSDLGPALLGVSGANWPTAGWWAGLAALDTWKLAGTHATPSPLGLGVATRWARRVTAVGRRTGGGAAWSPLPTLAEASPAPLVTVDRELLVPGAAPAQVAELGRQWSTTIRLSTGRDVLPWAWVPAGGWLCDADWAVDDHPLALGCRPLADGVALLVHGWGGEVTVAELAATDLGSTVPWPALWRRPDGQRVVGLLSGGRWREWSAPPDGRAWTQSGDESIDAPAGLLAVSQTSGRDGSLALVGYDPATGVLAAWQRAAPSAAWAGPYPLATSAEPLAAYLTQLADGAWEVGWPSGFGWQQQTAPTLAGPWSAR